MRPNTSPLSQVYACRCGDAHPALFRLFNMNILVCPEVQDDALHFVYEVPPKVSYLLTGVEGGAKAKKGKKG